MNPEAERLYNLLPALYHIRDVQEGEPLKALCAVIAEDIAALRENLDQLYDDQFIETCADWVAPYIGDLIGYRTLHGITKRTRSMRAEVANTIAYRRRKGTATMLEQLARDVTGWNARVVEFFQWLQTSQYMNHLRPTNTVTPDLRDWEALERRGTAFNQLAHSVDVRRIETQQGRYNIPNIGLFLWRLDAFSLTNSPAFRVDDHRYLFSPLGNDMQLFTKPETETDITHLATPLNVPEPISRRVLHEHVDQRRDDYYGEQKSLWIHGVAINAIRICNLSDSGAGWAHTPPPTGTIAIDPVLGRIACGDPQAQPPRVSYHHGFSATMGGGEYDRTESLVEKVTPGTSVPLSQPTVQAAFAQVTTGGVVEIGDSDRYEETLSITVSASMKVEIRAANEHRPTIVLDDDWVIKLGSHSELTLNGLLITGGQLYVMASDDDETDGPRILRLRHCTLVPGLTLTRTGEPGSPGQASLIVEATGLTLDIDHCILGAIHTQVDTMVTVANSIIDATKPTMVAFSPATDLESGGILSIMNSTVIGKVHAKRLDLASNTIFSSKVVSEQNQQGCVRFSFVPIESSVPRRYRCQPDLAVEQALREAERQKGHLAPDETTAITSATQARVRPVFTTSRYGLPAYCQLASYCPVEIHTGAEDESEMGAFHDLFAPQRERNLRIRLQEYLRFGLEAGIFYST
jgi:hypothetical protein